MTGCFCTNYYSLFAEEIHKGCLIHCGSCDICRKYNHVKMYFYASLAYARLYGISNISHPNEGIKLNKRDYHQVCKYFRLPICTCTYIFEENLGLKAGQEKWSSKLNDMGNGKSLVCYKKPYKYPLILLFIFLNKRIKNEYLLSEILLSFPWDHHINDRFTQYDLLNLVKNWRL